MFTLPEQIAENVAEAIVSGAYPPGSWIAEQDLANTFEVSRGPIREALRILEKEGLIQILPRRGTRVTQLTRAEVTDIFNIRAALMALSARLAAQHLSQDMRDEFALTVPKLERLAQGTDVDDFVRYAAHVSMQVASSSKNARLYAHIASMARLTLALTRLALEVKENRKIWSKNWKAVAESIMDGDAVKAEKAAWHLVSEQGKKAVAFAAEDHPVGQRVGKANGRDSRKV